MIRFWNVLKVAAAAMVLNACAGLLVACAGLLVACAPAVESTPVPNPGPGFEEQQKMMDQGRALEEAALAPLTLDFAQRVRNWKAMPLKNCSAVSFGGDDPLSRRSFDSAVTYQWDARALFDRTNGTMVVNTADFYFLVDLQKNGVIENKRLEDSSLIAEFNETNLRGGRSRIELRQAAQNCFLVVDGKVAYQTALFKDLPVSLHSNLNPVIQSKVGTKLEDGIVPHRVSLSMERDLFPFREGLGMKVDTRVPLAFFRGEYSPRRMPSNENLRQFLNFFHPQAYENLPVASSTVKFQDPALTGAGLWLEGGELQSPVVADGMRMILPVSADPFRANVLRFAYQFRGPAFDYLFYVNSGRRVLVAYTFDFTITDRTGTRISGALTSAGGRLEGLTPARQTQCLNEVLRTRPFDAGSELQSAQLFAACQSSEIDTGLAVFSPDFIGQMFAIYQDRQAFAPRVSETFVNEITRSSLARFGFEPLPAWWGAQKDWRYTETAKANAYLFAQIAKAPELTPFAFELVTKTQLYDSVFSARRFVPTALDKMIFVALRLSKAGLAMDGIMQRYQPSLWANMGENEIATFIDGVRGLRAEEKIRAMDNPQAVVQRVLAERREAERVEQVRRRAAEVDALLNGLSQELRTQANNVGVSRSFATFADRASRSQIRAEHLNRVNRWIALLKPLSGGDLRLDPVAAEVVADWRRLIESDLSTEDFRFVETILQAPAAQVSNYRELSQIHREWNVSSTRESRLQQASQALAMDVVRYLNSRRAELTSKTGLGLQELNQFAQFAVANGVIGGTADLPLLTDLILWTAQEVQNGANFIRGLERDPGVAGAKLWLTRAEDLKALNAQIVAAYAELPSLRPYLSAKRLTLALKGADAFDAFNAQIANNLAVIAVGCAPLDSCQQVAHDLLRMNLAGRVPTAAIDLTLLGAFEGARGLLGAGFEERFTRKADSVSNLQAVAMIQGYSYDLLEEKLNAANTRLASADVVEFLAMLKRELANPPSGTDRIKSMRAAFEATVLTTDAVLWSEGADLTATTKKIAETLKSIRATTNKDRLKKLDQDLRAALGL
ncbi:MAG: hypothetical protein KF767_14080 [Bdellovibrionaceae bacterium]|nr:hypothetical protein [Pseudobdellovibrionaceae bacterium]